MSQNKPPQGKNTEDKMKIETAGNKTTITNRSGELLIEFTRQEIEDYILEENATADDAANWLHLAASYNELNTKDVRELKHEISRICNNVAGLGA
jgi:hypothetical protein